MQNFRLLKDIGKSKVPVVLKRGIANTIEEWLDAAAVSYTHLDVYKRQVYQ